MTMILANYYADLDKWIAWDGDTAYQWPGQTGWGGSSTPYLWANTTVSHVGGSPVPPGDYSAATASVNGMSSQFSASYALDGDGVMSITNHEAQNQWHWVHTWWSPSIDADGRVEHAGDIASGAYTLSSGAITTRPAMVLIAPGTASARFRVQLRAEYSGSASNAIGNGVGAIAKVMSNPPPKHAKIAPAFIVDAAVVHAPSLALERLEPPPSALTGRHVSQFVRFD